MSTYLANSSRLSQQLLLLLVFFLCSALGVICFAESLHYPFLDWDDQTYIIKDTVIQELSLASLGKIWLSYYDAVWYPLARSSHAIDIWLFGHNAFYHRLVSLFIHSVNGLLVYLLSRWVIKLTLPSRDNFYAEIAAITAALVFIVHPQHVEVVAWLTQRNELLASTFFLLCLIQYCGYLSSQNKSSNNKAYYYFAILFAGVAMTAKPTAVGIPVILLIFDRLFSKNSLRVSLLEKTPFIVVAAAICYISIATHESSYAMKLHELYGLKQRICYAAYNILDFMYRFFVSTNLTPIVAMPNWIQTFSLRSSLPPICLALILVWCVLRLYRRTDITALLVIGYLTLILPSSGILMFGTYSPGNRYMYLPSALLLAFLALAFYKVITRLPASKKYYAIIPAMVLISLLSVVSRSQMLHWKNDLSLWKYVTKQQPQSATALTYLALQQVLHQQITLRQSAELIEKAAALEPSYVVLSNLLIIYTALNDLNMIVHTHARLAYYYPQTSGSSLANLGIYALRRGDTNKATELILAGIKADASLCVQIEMQYPDSAELGNIIQQARKEKLCD